MICKICDFGSSKFGIQTTKMTITGLVLWHNLCLITVHTRTRLIEYLKTRTFPWMSPELIQSKPANQSTDVWSYGVVLWELITGEVPFKGIEEFQIAFLVVEREHVTTRLWIVQICPINKGRLFAFSVCLFHRAVHPCCRVSCSSAGRQTAGRGLRSSRSWPN